MAAGKKKKKKGRRRSITCQFVDSSAFWSRAGCTSAPFQDSASCAIRQRRRTIGKGGAAEKRERGERGAWKDGLAVASAEYRRRSHGAGSTGPSTVSMKRPPRARPSRARVRVGRAEGRVREQRTGWLGTENRLNRPVNEFVDAVARMGLGGQPPTQSGQHGVGRSRCLDDHTGATQGQGCGWIGCREGGG